MTRFERLFVWLGGAAFVGSLALCAYMFAVEWGDAAVAPTRPVWQPVLVNVLLFTAFAAHHSIFAREPVKARLSRTVPDRLMRSVYVWTASLLLILVITAWRPIGGVFYRATGISTYVRAAGQLIGLFLIIRSVGAIDALELAGIRSHSSGELQTSGPYEFVRHPLYLGWMLTVFGAATMTGDRALFALITTLYLFIAMRWEERSLERTFGSAYTRYKERVRWRVIPFVY